MTYRRLPPYISARMKVARARNTWESIAAGFDQYAKTVGVEFRVAEDPDQPGAFAVWSVPSHPFPVGASMDVAGVIHGLRSALDHVAFELTMDAEIAPNRGRMPFEKDRTSVQNQLSTSLKKLPDRAKELILDVVKPYAEDGERDLVALNRLDNADKHRLLTVNVAAAAMANLNMWSSTLSFNGSTIMTHLMGPLMLYGVNGPDDLNQRSLGHLKSVDFQFQEPEIFPGPEDIPAFLNRVGDQVAGIVDLFVTEFAPDSEPDFDIHRDWAKIPLPKR